MLPPFYSTSSSPVLTLPYCQRAPGLEGEAPSPPTASLHCAPYLHPMLVQWLILASHQTVIMGESAVLSSLQLGTCHHATIPRLLGWDRKLREEGCAGVRGICSLPASAALTSFNLPHKAHGTCRPGGH